MDVNWTTPLVSAGADVAAKGDDIVEISLDGHRALFHLRRSLRSPRPAEVPVADGSLLLQVPHVSERVAEALSRRGWSFVTNDGNALLRFPDGFTWKSETQNVPERVDSPGAWSRGVSRVVHALLTKQGGVPPSQTKLAELTNLTQARVSKVVRDLVRLGLVRAEHGRPVIIDRDPLLDQWLAKRRFDPVVTYWWADSGDLASALDIAQARLPEEVIVSGDVAADSEAPHRRPEQLLILSRSGSLAGPGMLPVLTPSEANVVLAVTDDPVVVSSAHESTWRGRDLLLADPMQVLWDLLAASGTDAKQAADHWRSQLAHETQ